MATASPPTYLFVYGSLLRGEYNHGVLAEKFPGHSIDLVSPGVLARGDCYLLGNSSYPYLMFTPPAAALGIVAAPCHVCGEVYAIPAGASMAGLDEFEGLNEEGTESTLEYDRVQVAVALAGGGSLTCWVYAVTSAAAAAVKWDSVRRGRLAFVPSGDWHQYRRSAPLPAHTPSLTCSAPGKVLLAGGYLILQDGLRGLVLAASPRFHATAAVHALAAQRSPCASAPTACPPSASPLTQQLLAATTASLCSALTPGALGIVVLSPQFHAAWGYAATPLGAVQQVPLCPAACATLPPVLPPPPNAYAQAAIAVALAAALGALGERRLSARLQELTQQQSLLVLTLQADNEFYSQRWALQERGLPFVAASLAALPPHLPAPLKSVAGSGSSSSSSGAAAAAELLAPVVAKTGLGSSAALVTAVTGALLAWLGALRMTTASLAGEEEAAAAGGGGAAPPLTPLPCPSSTALLHAAAQVAHSLAQGKVGSGFDVASAVYGCLAYSRIPAAVLERAVGEGGRLLLLQQQQQESGAYHLWCTGIAALAHVEREGRVGLQPFAMPPRLGLLLGDVAGGSETPGMVRQVLAWRERGMQAEGAAAAAASSSSGSEQEGSQQLQWLLAALSSSGVHSTALGALAAQLEGPAGAAYAAAAGPREWRELASANAVIEALLGLLAQASAAPGTAEAYDSAVDCFPELSTAAAGAAADAAAAEAAPAARLHALLHALCAAFLRARSGLRQLGLLSGVAIEPAAQGALLDATAAVPGVLAAGVPGAGGCDAVFCVLLQGKGVEGVVEGLWAAHTGLSVTRLPVSVGAGRGQQSAGVLFTAEL